MLSMEEQLEIAESYLRHEEILAMTEQSANERQVGGGHYSNMEAEQHWDRMWKLYGEAWFVGNITKYIERYKKKDGLKDLEKCRHYLDKLIELETAKEANNGA